MSTELERAARAAKEEEYEARYRAVAPERPYADYRWHYTHLASGLTRIIIRAKMEKAVSGEGAASDSAP